MLMLFVDCDVIFWPQMGWTAENVEQVYLAVDRRTISGVSIGPLPACLTAN